jgi:hypothetical protein
LFYVARGRFSAQETQALACFLERLGSCVVFLIDWNRARKLLRLLVPNETAVRILRWAADHEVGHRGFLNLGGERLVYDALEQAVKTPLRYGEPLHEMIGKDVAQDYLCYVLQTAANGLLKGQSVALIRDQVRAELFNHFRSAEQRLLAHAGGHASIIVQLAGGLRAALRQSASSEEALTRHAAKAKRAESRADEIVKKTRLTVRRIPGTEVFRRIIEVADDAVDDLEDSAFLAGLLSCHGTPLDLPAPLLGLADLWPSSMTGTRLIFLASSRSTISPSVAVSSTVKTSRVMMSATRFACDLAYSSASREFDENGSLQRGRWVPISTRRNKSPSVTIPTRHPSLSRIGTPLMRRLIISLASPSTVASGDAVATALTITSLALITSSCIAPRKASRARASLIDLDQRQHSRHDLRC